MKKHLTILLALGALSAQAQIKQTWTNSFYDANLQSRTYDTIVSPNGSTFTFAGTSDGMGRVVKWDGLGNPVWSQAIPETFDAYAKRLIRVDSAGDVVIALRTNTNLVKLKKIDESTGAVVWAITANGLTTPEDLVVDAQDNIVLLGYGAIVGSYGPVVQKLSPSGNVLFSHMTAKAGFDADQLAVAANGQIYLNGFKYNPGQSESFVEALTPNGTLRYTKSWTHTGATARSTFGIAADRNGRFCSAQLAPEDGQTFNIRTFDSAGNMTTIPSTLIGRSIQSVDTLFDANGRFVVGLVRTMGSNKLASAEWFSVTDTTAASVAAAEVPAEGAAAPSMKGFFADAFGQSYIATSLNNAGFKGAVYALDEYHSQPLWKFVEPGNKHPQPDVSAAVGRWGQVSMATSVGYVESYEAASGIKQLGLRNLTINGQSFTGGRTITGTVNFYSNDSMDRSVAMSSSTPFATIAGTSTVTAGSSQATMSIDLLPTSVRRAVRIDGVFNGTKRSAVFYIEPPVSSSLTLFPTTVKGGKNVNATARINGAAPTGGMAIAISSSDPAATVPASVTVAEGTVAKGFVIGTATVNQTKTATITATTGSTSKTATLTITP